MAVDVGVTMYCTVPAALLLGLVSVCAMVAPDPPVAPVMLPVMVPTVQVKVLGVLAVSAILVAVPLQMVAVFAVVTTGEGFTVTVMICVFKPWHPTAAVEVGVMMYSTVPAVLLLGLLRVWAIVAPAPAVAPVIPPVIVPIVQVNELGAVEVSAILVAVLLQMVAVLAVVTTGLGFTVTMML